MNYKETVDYLYRSAPLFQQKGGEAYKEGLSTTHVLDQHFGHPHTQYKTIHIGGTNGKGSTAHTLAAILQHAGYKVGLYTSPHLTDFRERIRINGEKIPQQRVIDFVERERSFFEPLHPSFFELTTALAFLYFAEEQVDVAVIEVGLGGRLDCTNIIRPILSVITNISFDHTQFLGNTLAAIAREKAGIIKPRVPVVIGETTVETRPVFERKAKEENAPIVFAEENMNLRVEKDAVGRNVFVTNRYGIIVPELQGDYQIKNAATILAAVGQLAELNIQKEDVRAGFEQVGSLTGLQGRWQQISDAPLTICDTGHNVGGWQYIVPQLVRLVKDRKSQLHLVIGVVNDKDVTKMLSLIPASVKFYFTQASVERALPARDLLKKANNLGRKGQSFLSVREAVSAAQTAARPADVIYIGGSTFVVADFLANKK